jgi:ATP-dependent helicase HrpB
MNLDPQAVRRVERVRRQIERLLGLKTAGSGASLDAEDEILISILAGYPDRVARRRSSSVTASDAGVELSLAGGGSAVLAPESLVRTEEFMVAVEAEERRGPRKGAAHGPSATVSLASAIEPEWLLDLFAERIKETTEVEWNAQRERVEAVSRLIYEGITLEESRTGASPSESVAKALSDALLSTGYENLIEREEVERFIHRIDFLRRTFPEADFPELDEPEVWACLLALCEGRSSLAELREAVRAGELQMALRARLGPERAGMLAKLAPERVTLAGGRSVRINYEKHNSPWIASRLQDFFGMKTAPRIGGGRVPLVIHLLAPNRRAVQVTTDLEGFWSRHYAQIRRELSRRYPRHAWPENPHNPNAK